MVDRIREILRARQLTPTQFADTIGVARPIVSHILSGRNKPSLEVVQKIVEAFPDLSLAWILKGSGSMDGELVPTTASIPTPPPLSTRQPGPKAPETPRVAPTEAQPAVVATMSAKRPAERSAELNIELATRGTLTEELAWGPSASTVANVAFNNPQTDEEAGVPTAAAVDIPGNRTSPAQAPNVSPVSPSTIVSPSSAPTSNAAIPPVAQALAEHGKSIRRIVIFYQDGTFTDYQPETK